MIREYLQKKFIRFLIKDVFHTISPEDILRIKGNVWTWKDKELSEETVSTLKAQAQNFVDSTLWKILKAEIQWSAAKTLLERGTNETDVRIAQIQGYLTKVIDDKLKEMK